MTLANRAADYMKRKGKGGRKKEDKLWSEIKERMELGLEARRPFEQRWIINLAFLAGKQYSYFNATSHSLQQLKPVKKRVRKVDNQLLPRVRRQLSDFIKNKPEMSVVPNSHDDDDIQAAKVGTKVLQSWWRSNKMGKKVRKLGGWVFVTGNAFLDDRWNRKLGPVSMDKDGLPTYGGDADCGVWSPFEILVPFVALGTTELHDFPWMMKIKWRGLDYLAENYKRGKEVSSEQTPSPVMDAGLVLEGLGKAFGDRVKGAWLCELYVKPSATWPKGVFLTGANGIVLEKADWPYQRYSMEHFKDVDLSGVFWGKATMEEGIGLQKSWNKLVSDVEEFNRTMGKGKILIPHGSKMHVDPDDTHGQLLHYKPVMGHKPEAMTLKGVPGTYEFLAGLIQGSFDNLFSQHEVSRGTNRSDLRSGEMVALLREQDSHGQIPMHVVFEEGIEEITARILQRVQGGYTEERMLKVSGKDDEYEVFAFKGTDLRNNTDVSVKKQSSVPDSRLAREFQIMDRFERGVYGPREDPEVRRHVQNMLDDAVVKDIYSDTIRDEKVARWENRILLKQGVSVNPYDNHGVHLLELNMFRKGMDYQKFKVGNPGAWADVDSRFLAHAMEHQKYLAEARAAALEEQMLLEGKGGSSGKG